MDVDRKRVNYKLVNQTRKPSRRVDVGLYSIKNMLQLSICMAKKQKINTRMIRPAGSAS